MNTEQTLHHYHNADYGVITRLRGPDQRWKVGFSILPRERLVSDIEERIITIEKILQGMANDLLIDSRGEL